MNYTTLIKELSEGTKNYFTLGVAAAFFVTENGQSFIKTFKCQFKEAE